ncbi:Calcineurin-like metallo-phosphoesterase superfamily protein [Zea mays]|uniref:Calcineurin-like metallo-phosphoesterase superfamily protein n=1 Tax=Zea mays TaxID=4577 RepID=A0A1D6J6K8_MAIZE|nr:Calcineurin-like metallo-phosphoesterase superfamily protein [Zea mays]
MASPMVPLVSHEISSSVWFLASFLNQYYLRFCTIVINQLQFAMEPIVRFTILLELW